MSERIKTRWKLVAVAAVVFIPPGIINVRNLINGQGDVASFIIINAIMIILIVGLIFLFTKKHTPDEDSPAEK